MRGTFLPNCGIKIIMRSAAQRKTSLCPGAQPFTALTNDIVNDVDPWVGLRGSAGVGRMKHQFTSSVMY